MSLQILPVEGIPELRPGDDLPAAIAQSAPWLQDGDVVVVTSKAVSKVEGRLVQVAPEKREDARQQAIDDETVRVVAARGTTRIVQTRQGFVTAAAGVDASNVRRDEIALLPLDPDASARSLRDGLARALGVEIAVVVTDTAGRPWRTGVSDYAIGAAGIAALQSLRGRLDPMGNELIVTEIAVADEIAAAADLVKGKLSGIPAAVVRGLGYDVDEQGVRPLVRPADADLFRLGTAEALAQGRREAARARPPVPGFGPGPVDPAALTEALGAFGRGTVVLVETEPMRAAVLEALAPGPAADVARAAPVLAVPCLAGPEFGIGAAVERVLVALAAEDLAGRWAPASGLAEILGLDREPAPTGLLGIGPAPAGPTAGRTGEPTVLRR